MSGARSAANVSANHVFCGEADYHGGPYGEPVSASPFSEAKYGKPAEGERQEVAVLDTGYDPQIQTLHLPASSRGSSRLRTPENPLTGGYLAQEAGHGIVHRRHHHGAGPAGERILQVTLLNPAGVTDDVPAAWRWRSARWGTACQ